MTEHALRAAIAAFPEEDTPRLVFADFLDENGDSERAEFIRVQIELERTPKADPRFVELWRRETELLADHGEDWARDELPDGITARLADEDRYGRSVAFRRGTPERVAATAHGFLRGGAELAALPSVALNIEWLERDENHKPRPESLPDRVRQLAGCPALEHFPRLNVKYNRLGPAGLEILLNSPHLPALREFAVGPDRYGPRGAELLANCAQLSGPRELDASACRVGDEGLRRLLASPFLRNIEEFANSADLTDDGFELLARHEPMRNWRALELGYNDVGLRGVRALLTSPHLTRLERLDIGSLMPQPRTWLGDALAREIVRVGLPPTLRRLNLHTSKFTPAGVAELVRSDRLERVTELDLILNAVGAPGAEALAASPHLKGIELLRLYKTELDDAAAVALAASPHLRPFHVNLANNAIGPAGMAALADSPLLSRVLTLGLYENIFGDEGARHLTRAPWLARLCRLDLTKCGIGPAGVTALAASPNLGGLVSLGLRDNPVGNAGAIALANSPHVARLRKLNLQDALIGDAGAFALARSEHLNCLRELRLTKNRIGDAARTRLRDRFGPGATFEMK